MSDADYRLFLEGCVEALLRHAPPDAPAWPDARQSAAQVLSVLSLARRARFWEAADYRRWCDLRESALADEFART